MHRRIVHYSGRVQGVGFRYTTNRVAANFDVVGFVRNLTDGRVELVADALPAELDRFLAAVADAMAGNIDSQTVEQVDFDQSNTFDNVEIRY